MINERSLAQFEPLGDKLLKPIYETYSFGNISPTIHFLLTGEKIGPLLPPDCFGGAYPSPEKIVLIFIDAFGWQSWQRYRESIAPMRRIAESGVVTPISALFPSTTAASVTTLNLGVLPAQHAIYEWNIYVPAFGEVVYPLLFSPLGVHARNRCAEKGYDPADMFAVRETMHERLARHGVRSLQFTHQQHLDSVYNRIASKGAELTPHTTLAQGMLQLRQAVEATRGKACFSLYWPSIDSIAHQYGPGSAFHEAESRAFWAAFEAILGGMNSPDTLYLFTADHDQVAARADETIYINERWPELADIPPASPTGQTIWPNGSPRDLFLHVKPDRVGEVLALLKRELDGAATVLTIDDAIAEGLFGAVVGDELRRRLGDILVLAHDGYFVGWREPGLMENHFNGHHGGLAANELISVFAATDRI